MAIYAISDLHLPIGIDKPMDIFGKKWENYVSKIEENWKNQIKDEDFIIISGDISWATYLDESLPDFRFIESLPGTKIISKGNHDYWWQTMNKLDNFLKENDFKTIHFIHNNSFMIGDTAVTGSRGWITPLDKDFKADDEKIYKRELGRLELSIKDAIKKGAKDIIVSIHYPPYAEFLEICEKYGVKKVLYGHLHSENKAFYTEISPITKLVSCDYLEFFPEKVE